MVEASPEQHFRPEITGKKFDLIACVSLVYEDFGIPEGKGSWHADRSVRGQGSR